jgi:hypothetical protein
MARQRLPRSAQGPAAARTPLSGSGNAYLVNHSAARGFSFDAKEPAMTQQVKIWIGVLVFALVVIGIVYATFFAVREGPTVTDPIGLGTEKTSAEQPETTPGPQPGAMPAQGQ